MQAFIQSLKKEWAKITWPKSIFKSVLLVLAVSVIVGAVISAVDHFSQAGIHALLGIRVAGVPAFWLIAAIAFMVLCAALIVIVLMQEGKGDALSGLSGQSFWDKGKSRSMEGRLTKLTYILVFAFLILALVLSMHPA